VERPFSYWDWGAVDFFLNFRSLLEVIEVKPDKENNESDAPKNNAYDSTCIRS